MVQLFGVHKLNHIIIALKMCILTAIWNVNHFNSKYLFLTATIN